MVYCEKEGIAMSEKEVDKCPKCGGEMKRGHISFGTEVRWKDEESQGEEVLTYGSFWGFHKKLEACRCGKCRLVIFYY